MVVQKPRNNKNRDKCGVLVLWSADCACSLIILFEVVTILNRILWLCFLYCFKSGNNSVPRFCAHYLRTGRRCACLHSWDRLYQSRWRHFEVGTLIWMYNTEGSWTSLNKVPFSSDNPLRSAFGTTKYCSFFLRDSSCAVPDCLFLHEMAPEVGRPNSLTSDPEMSRMQFGFIHNLHPFTPSPTPGWHIPSWRQPYYYGCLFRSFKTPSAHHKYGAAVLSP